MLVYFFVHVATTTKNDTYLHPPSLHVDLSIVIAYRKEATAEDSVGQTKQGGMMRGPTRQDLKAVGPDRQVTAVRYCGDTYHVTTAAGETIPFWAFNLRFKTDSSDKGPAQGDRKSVVSGKSV